MISVKELGYSVGVCFTHQESLQQEAINSELVNQYFRPGSCSELHFFSFWSIALSSENESLRIKSAS